MGFGFRKSINLGGGVRLNFSKRGIGASVGVKGFRVGIGPSGLRTRATLPGTGLYYEKRQSLARPERKRQMALREQMRRQEIMDALQQAQLEVEAFQNRLEMLLSVHKECSEPIDWKMLSQQAPPFEKGQPGPNEQAAREKLEAYEPGFFEKLFRRDDDRKKQLQEEVEKGKALDVDLYDEWEATKEVAERVLAGDPEAYKMAIETMAPFDDIVDLGSGFDFHFIDQDVVEVTFHVEPQEVIPDTVKSLTKTGRLSQRKMGKTMFYAYYQDYVCSCVIRVARELFALLPIRTVVIHADDTELNTATGHDETITILSVRIHREDFQTINFDRIDCSDAIESFEHHMHFLKTKGFQKVNKLSLTE